MKNRNSSKIIHITNEESSAIKSILKGLYNAYPHKYWIAIMNQMRCWTWSLWLVGLVYHQEMEIQICSWKKENQSQRNSQAYSHEHAEPINIKHKLSTQTKKQNKNSVKGFILRVIYNLIHMTQPVQCLKGKIERMINR